LGRTSPRSRRRTACSGGRSPRRCLARCFAPHTSDNRSRLSRSRMDSRTGSSPRHRPTTSPYTSHCTSHHTGTASAPHSLCRSPSLPYMSYKVPYTPHRRTHRHPASRPCSARCRWRRSSRVWWKCRGRIGRWLVALRR
jgi:hypothetical protein